VTRDGDPIEARQPQDRANRASGEPTAGPGRSSIQTHAPSARSLGDFAIARAAVGPPGLRPGDRADASLPFATSLRPRGMPLRLTLSDRQVWAISARYQRASRVSISDSVDDVVVVVQNEQVPMRDVSQEVWGGLAAPFWAILHPAQAWRIFLPIPPK
jgi:hypothetical protein